MNMRRQPDATRQRLLEAAFAEMHRNGFHASSLDQILRATEVTKGALYHHFRNKQALGLAVIEEVVRPWVETRWRPMLEADRPLEAAIAYVAEHARSVDEDMLALGCPFACAGRPHLPAEVPAAAARPRRACESEAPAPWRRRRA